MSEDVGECAYPVVGVDAGWRLERVVPEFFPGYYGEVVGVEPGGVEQVSVVLLQVEYKERDVSLLELVQDKVVEVGLACPGFSDCQRVPGELFESDAVRLCLIGLSEFDAGLRWLYLYALEGLLEVFELSLLEVGQLFL